MNTDKLTKANLAVSTRVLGAPCIEVFTVRKAAFGLEKSMDALIESACAIAQRGAAEYLVRNDLKAESSALASCLKSWVKIKLPEALHDAKQAIDCHMTQIAETTFAASMIQAGIEAAKEAGFPN